MIKRLLIAALVLAGCRQEVELVTEPADYVSTLVGTLSEHSFSTGNTYPAIALPWGMNFWTPVTGKMGDGGHTAMTHIIYAVSSRPTNLRHGSMITGSSP